MAINPLRQQALEMRQSLFDEGILDKQFILLEKVEDGETGSFAEEAVNSFCSESIKRFAKMDEELSQNPVDFCLLWTMLHSFKSSCVSVGASQLRRQCDALRPHCEAGIAERFKAPFEEIKELNAAFRNKMECYFQILRDAAAAEGGQSTK